jgi:hypothetical protein
MAPEPVNIVRYIYGHNAAGYCASVFSAHNCVGTGSAIRRNRCSNNAQIAGFAYPGEIFIDGNGAPVSGPPRRGLHPQTLPPWRRPACQRLRRAAFPQALSDNSSSATSGQAGLFGHESSLSIGQIRTPLVALAACLQVVSLEPTERHSFTLG